MTKDMTFQHVSWTLSLPGKHVVGVFGSLQEAEQAVQALVDAGYHVEDMALIPSQDFPSAFQEHLRKEGRFLQIMHHLQVTTDEGSLRELLEASARQGSAIISLYVPQREHIDEVSALLFNHGARLVNTSATGRLKISFHQSKRRTSPLRLPRDWATSQSQTTSSQGRHYSSPIQLDRRTGGASKPVRYQGNRVGQQPARILTMHRA